MQHADDDLSGRIPSGDYGAFKKVFESQYAALVKTAYRMIPDQPACEDIVQEVFIELWKKREVLSIHTSLKAYLRQAVVNRSLNYIKNKKRLRWESDADAVETPLMEDNAFDQMHAADLERMIQRAIASLPEKCRLVFVLSRWEDMSHKDIAESLGISVKTVENHMTKALKLMRQTLSKAGFLSFILHLGWLLLFHRQ